MFSNKILLLKGKGKLDKYKNSLVMGFSYYKLLSSYKGYCVRVRRSSDNTIQDFGFKNGYIDYEAILAFVDGGSGYVAEWLNQYASGNNAVQTANSNQPLIVDSGIFKHEGIYFDGSNYYLRILNYSALELINEPLGLYLNTYPTLLSNTGYVFYRGLSSSSNIHYSILKTSAPAFTFAYNNLVTVSGTTSVINNTNKVLYNWFNKSANGFISYSGANVSNGTIGISLTNNTNTYIGCRSNSIDGELVATFYIGNVKTVCIFNNNVDYNIISKV